MMGLPHLKVVILNKFRGNQEINPFWINVFSCYA